MRGWYIKALVIAASLSAGQFITNNIAKKKERQNNIWKHEMKQKWIASILKILIPTEVLSIHQGPRRSLWNKMKLRPHKQEKNPDWLKNLVLFTHYDNMMHTLPSLTSSLSSLFDLPTQFGDKYYDKKISSWLVWYSGCIADPIFTVKPLMLWTMTQQVKRLKMLEEWQDWAHVFFDWIRLDECTPIRRTRRKS